MNIKLDYPDRSFLTPRSAPSALRVRYDACAPQPREWPAIAEKIREILIGQRLPKDVYMWNDESKLNGVLKRDHEFGRAFRKGKVFRDADLKYIGPNFFIDYDWSEMPWHQQLNALREEYERESLIEHAESLHRSLGDSTVKIIIESRWDDSDRAYAGRIELTCDEARYLAEALKLAVSGKLALEGLQHRSDQRQK